MSNRDGADLGASGVDHLQRDVRASQGLGDLPVRGIVDDCIGRRRSGVHHAIEAGARLIAGQGRVVGADRADGDGRSVGLEPRINAVRD